MDDGDLEDLSIYDAKAAIRDFKTKNVVTVDPKKTAKKKGTSRGNMNDCLETDQAKLMEMGWSTARVKALCKKRKPKCVLLPLQRPGRKAGYWRVDRKGTQSLLVVIKDGVDYRWGILSIKVPGRVGYQCSNYYRLLIEKGVLSDPNYTMIEYKDAKTGNRKKKLKFTRPKVIVPNKLKVTGDYAAATASNPKNGARKAKRPKLTIRSQRRRRKNPKRK